MLSDAHSNKPTGRANSPESVLRFAITMKHADQVFIASKQLRIALERVQTAPSTAERARAAKWARAWNRAI
jgi:hypothetical protein